MRDANIRPNRAQLGKERRDASLLQRSIADYRRAIEMQAGVEVSARATPPSLLRAATRAKSRCYAREISSSREISSAQKTSYAREISSSRETSLAREISSAQKSLRGARDLLRAKKPPWRARSPPRKKTSLAREISSSQKTSLARVPPRAFARLPARETRTRDSDARACTHWRATRTNDSGQRLGRATRTRDSDGSHTVRSGQRGVRERPRERAGRAEPPELRSDGQLPRRPSRRPSRPSESSSESYIRGVRPSYPSESTIRVIYPSHLSESSSESSVRVIRPSRRCASSSARRSSPPPTSPPRSRSSPAPWTP